MLNKRPSLSYLLFFAIALVLWCIGHTVRLPVAGFFLIVALFSYRVPGILLKPTSVWIALWSGLLLAFFQFVLFGNYNEQLIAIYNVRWVNSVSYTLGILITLQWYCWRSSRFNWLLFSTGLFMISAGISEPLQAQRGLYFSGVILFFLSLLIYLFWRTSPIKLNSSKSKSPGRWHLRGLGIGLIFLFVSSSFTFIRSAEFVDQRLNDMLNTWIQGAQTDWSGFSGRTRLRGNQSIKLSNAIAFVIQGPSVPEYWRGNILTRYDRGTWSPEEILHAPLPYQFTEKLNFSGSLKNRAVSEQALYSVQGNLIPQARSLSPSQKLYPLQVSMKNHFNGLIFHPKETVLVSLPKAVPVYQNRYGLLRRELRQPAHNYTLWLHKDNFSRAVYDENLRKENLQIPPDIKRALLPLAHEITRGATDDNQRALAIQSWFHANFHYSLSMGPTASGIDPTVDFVLNRKPAWCSWYASGMTLMLRSLGIPAHLVSGWRSMDYNPLARQWVVREKEAHDWVEILDTANNSWRVYDPTPAGELAEITGSGASEGLLSQALTALKLRFEQWQSNLFQQSPSNILQRLQTWLLNGLSQPWFYLVLVALLVLNQWFKRRKSQHLRHVEPLEYTPLSHPSKKIHQRFTHWIAERELPPLQSRSLLHWQRDVKNQLSLQEQQLLNDFLQAWLCLRFAANTTQKQTQNAEKYLDALIESKSKPNNQDIIV